MRLHAQYKDPIRFMSQASAVASCQFVLVTPDTGGRAALEQYVRDGLAHHYGANITQFMPYLLGS